MKDKIKFMLLGLLAFMLSLACAIGFGELMIWFYGVEDDMLCSLIEVICFAVGLVGGCGVLEILFDVKVISDD